MDRIDAMQAFVTVADLQGFAPAARKLGLSPSGVTRLIAALEERLGARLLQRTTRLGDADRCRRALSGARPAHPWRCRGSRKLGRGRTHPAGRPAGGLGAGRVWAAPCQPGDVGLSEALSRGQRRTAAVGSHDQSGGRRRRSGGADRPPRRIPRWWRAMSARCGGSWWPRRIISSARRAEDAGGDRLARHHPVRRHDRGAGLALRRGRPRDPRRRARRALPPTAPTPRSSMPSRAAA